MKWLLTLWLVLQSYDEAMTRGVAAMEAGRFREAEGRCCTARSKSLTSLCRSESHPAQ